MTASLPPRSVSYKIFQPRYITSEYTFACNSHFNTYDIVYGQESTKQKLWAVGNWSYFLILSCASSNGTSRRMLVDKLDQRFIFCTRLCLFRKCIDIAINLFLTMQDVFHVQLNLFKSKYSNFTSDPRTLTSLSYMSPHVYRPRTQIW